jgi:hypothetical protein
VGPRNQAAGPNLPVLGPNLPSFERRDYSGMSPIKALKPRNVQHAMWNAGNRPARIVEVLTPGGTERWFEEIAALPDGDRTGFESACRRHGIEFFPDSQWTAELRERYEIASH